MCLYANGKRLDCGSSDVDSISTRHPERKRMIIGYPILYGKCPTCGAERGRLCTDRRKTTKRPDKEKSEPHVNRKMML